MKTQPVSRSTPSTLEPGTVLAGRYVIEGILGIGGMGAVYSARDRRFRAHPRRCAVKEMFNALVDPTARRQAVENFEREANILASLNHPAIPKIFDYFNENDRHYVVLEYVEGQDLAKYIAQRARPITPLQAVDWGIQLCDVLEYLHNQTPPIVFRDLKPSNIMLRPDGRLVLVDFGIAKHFQEAERATMVGTEGYASPEQYEGMATPKVDIYALGATLHHLLTNTDPREFRPFSFASRPIRHYNPAVPPELEQVIMKALAEDPDERWESAAELRKALEALLPSLQAEATPTRPITRLIQRTAGLHGSAPPTLRKPGHSAVPRDTQSGIEPVWTFKCEEEVRSTPCIEGDRLYIGCYDHNLYCLDANTGQFIWKYPTEGGIPGTPTTWKHLVIVGSEDYRVYGINRTSGRLEWTFATKGKIRSSPRVHGDFIFIGSDDGHIYAIDARRGTGIWRHATHAPVRSSACFFDRLLYIGAEDGLVYALDLATGEVRWRARTNGAVISSPSVYEDRVICGSMDWTVYAFDVNSGWVIWRFRTTDRIVSSPFVYEKYVYIGSVDGHIYCLNAEWGELVWKYKTDHQVTSSPWVENGFVYCGSVDGHMYCLDAKRGKLVWRYRTGGPIPGSPRTAHGKVYFGSLDHHVYALQAEGLDR